MTVAVTGFTLTTAVGRGTAATLRALRERRGGLRHKAFPASTLDTWVGMVDGVEATVLPQEWARYDCRSNRIAELALQQDGFIDAVLAARERVGPRRVGVYLGTSSAGILEVEQGYIARGPARGPLPAGLDYLETMNLFSPALYLRERLALSGPAAVVSAACASSAKAFAAGARAIAAGWCDVAVVGGVETLCLTTLHGFASLGLLSATPCRPCDAGRDGISLGEGAAFALLEAARPGASGPRLLGYGESADAYHLSTPHPEGIGAARAMRAALAMSGVAPGAVDYINLHGTGTRTNDIAEDVAIRGVFGGGVASSSTKGWTGHMLGAAGAAEAVITLLAVREGLIPGTLNCDTVDAEILGNIERVGRDAEVRVAATNSFGFGGSNCTLVFGGDPR
jgi:3-oxoacyl-[acyl-carrier-protein] synthase-1